MHYLNPKKSNLLNVESFPQLKINEEIPIEKLTNSVAQQILEETVKEQQETTNDTSTIGVFNWNSQSDQPKQISYRDEGFSYGGLRIKDFACRVFEKLGWIQKISFQAERRDNMSANDPRDPSMLTQSTKPTSFMRSVYIWRGDRNKFEKDFLTDRMEKISNDYSNFVMIQKKKKNNSTEGTLLYKKDGTIKKLHYTTTPKNAPLFFRLFNGLINKNTSQQPFKIGNQRIFLSQSDAKTLQTDTGITPLQSDEEE